MRRELSEGWVFRAKTFERLFPEMEPVSNRAIEGTPIGNFVASVEIVASYAGVPLTAPKLEKVKKELAKLPRAHKLREAVIESFLSVIRNMITED